MQSLLDSGWLTFQEQKLSVEKNPLSSHGGNSTCANIDQVAVIQQKRDVQSFTFVHPYLPNEQLGNWESVDLPSVSTGDQM